MNHRTILRIGQSTLSIYIIHYIILYGSFTGLGLYYFLNHSLSPILAIAGAFAFILITTVLALRYEENKALLKQQLYKALKVGQLKVENWLNQEGQPTLKAFIIKTKLGLMRLFRMVKN